MAWLLALLVVVVVAAAVRASWRAGARDYDAIEHRANAMRVLARINRSESDQRKGGDRDEDAAGEG